MCGALAWSFVKRHVAVTVPGVVGVFTITFCLVLAIEAGEVGAAWVQAIGSIIALVGAAWLPIIHSRKAARDRAVSALENMRVIAEVCEEDMWMLSNLFWIPDEEVRQMQGYLRAGRDHSWASTKAALSIISMVDIPPSHVEDFVTLRKAIEYSDFIARKLPDWISEGSSNPEVLSAFRALLALLGGTLSKLSIEGGVSDRLRISRDFGAANQLRYSQPEPIDIDGVKVYVNYGGREEGSPSKIYLQVVYPFGDKHPPRYELKRDDEGWTSYEEAVKVVKEFSKKLIEREREKF
ncbi:hypothetical protein [Pseudomonas aeruginosa]|uniref:hypothetical protein n=1 Tax=Pseudomonas aeruginosa TaxID=287 RepID=UPI0013C4520D|nr:hypothetical protein [Pseudomonas aeruginosa]